MPQFDLTYFPAEIIWTLISFVLLFVLLKWLVLPRITAALDQRTREMKQEMEQARQAREQAELLHLDYVERLKQAEAEANKMFDESEKKARAHRNKLMDEWQQEMDRRKREFHDEVEQSKLAAMREMQEKSADLIIDATEKVLRQRNQQDQTEAAVNELLTTLEEKAAGSDKPRKN